MVFTPYTVEGLTVDGLSHVNAIQILLTELAEQVNTLNSSPTVKVQIESLDGTVTLAATSVELSAVIPTPVIQALTENQLTGSLSASLALPVKNSYSNGAVLTESRIVFGIDT